MKIHQTTGKELIPPFWYAFGAVFAVPIVALGMALATVCLVLSWPFVPILMYLQRRKELE